MPRRPLRYYAWRARVRGSARARQAVPEVAKPALRTLLAATDPLVVAGYRRRLDLYDPIPPRRLRAGIGAPDIRRFVQQGADVVDVLEDGAGRAGTSVLTAPRVLDFGCGCGRVLMPLLRRRRIKDGLVGSDVSVDAIDWLRGVAGDRIDLAVNDFAPPLPFPDDSFDLLYSISILTHLDKAGQDAWMADMARVVRPGGVVMVSIHAEHPYEVVRAGDQPMASDPGLLRRLNARGSLADEGMVFEPYTRHPASEELFAGITGEYGQAFQSVEWTHERMAPHAELVAALPLAITNWQDLLVFRVS